ncbi:hypothetical protein ACXFAU_04765 [Paenibacillus glucanolyticus]
MDINILGISKDLRTDTPVIYAQMNINDYLDLIGTNFGDFFIQRKRETHKAYRRMKKDIIEGTILPTITLAVKPDYVDEIKPFFDAGDFESLRIGLAKEGTVNILDGLQRSYILKDIKDSGTAFKEGQKLFVEFWMEKDIKHLIYRIIVLNSGQKPMSMRHQVELLFLTLKEKLEKDIEGLEIYLERDLERRTRPQKFPLEKLVTAYQSFLSKSPEIKRENIVAKQLIDNDILDSDEDELAESFSKFENYLKVYVDLDVEVHRLYTNGKSNWLADENVINSFFAALSDFGKTDERVERINTALLSLLELLRRSNQGDDPLGLDIFNDIKNGLNPKQDNIGYATRKLLTSSFKEFFRDEGERSLADCWLMEAR